MELKERNQKDANSKDGGRGSKWEWEGKQYSPHDKCQKSPSARQDNSYISSTVSTSDLYTSLHYLGVLFCFAINVFHYHGGAATSKSSLKKHIFEMRELSPGSYQPHDTCLLLALAWKEMHSSSCRQAAEAAHLPLYWVLGFDQRIRCPPSLPSSLLSSLRAPILPSLPFILSLPTSLLSSPLSISMQSFTVLPPELGSGNSAPGSERFLPASHFRAPLPALTRTLGRNAHPLTQHSEGG